MQWSSVNNKKNYLLTVDLLKINLCTIVMKIARFAITEKLVDSVLTPPSPMVRLVGKWVLEKCEKVG